MTDRNQPYSHNAWDDEEAADVADGDEGADEADTDSRTDGESLR